MYAVWSGWKRDAATDRTPQHLYIAPMSNPWTISSAGVRRSSPAEPWELGTELELREGPQFLERAGATFPVYSTRESWLPDYRLSTRSPDGTEDWIVYHAKTSAARGWDRVIRMQPFTWAADGSPRFGAPVSSGQRIAVPSGECR